MKQKAVFLDRDGVINRERGDWVYRINDFEININLIESLQILRDKGYVFIVVTNQSGISKGVYTHSDVNALHRYLGEVLSRSGIRILEIFYCPHHDETGRCLCRKPDSLMIEKALAKYNIDAKQSILIGDKPRDIYAAEKAGVKGLLINPDESILKIATELPLASEKMK